MSITTLTSTMAEAAVTVIQKRMVVAAAAAVAVVVSSHSDNHMKDIITFMVLGIPLIIIPILTCNNK
jgi:hypothetical protein